MWAVVPHDAANIMLIEEETRGRRAAWLSNRGQAVPSDYGFPWTCPTCARWSPPASRFSSRTRLLILAGSSDCHDLDPLVCRRADPGTGQVIGFLNLDSSVPGFFTQGTPGGCKPLPTRRHRHSKRPALRRNSAARGGTGTARGRAHRTAQPAKEQVEAALAREIELNEIKSRFISIASHEFARPWRDPDVQRRAGALRDKYLPGASSRSLTASGPALARC